MKYTVLLFVIAISLWSTSATAYERNSVEVDMSVLSDMIERRYPSSPQPVPALPPPITSSARAASPIVQINTPPLPTIKPTPPAGSALPAADNILMRIDEPPTVDIPKVEAKPIHSQPLPQNMRFIYGSGEIAPTGNVLTTIQKNLLPLFEKDDNLRAALFSFASSADEGQSSARRIALARAIALREELVENGLDPARVDLMPRGNEGDGLPADRIDIIFSQH